MTPLFELRDRLQNRENLWQLYIWRELVSILYEELKKMKPQENKESN